MAIKVTLRQKSISGNRKSLYLDFYPPIPNPKTGKDTRREFLGQYIFAKAKSPIDKQHNKQTEQLAEQIRQKRYNELNKPEIYTEFEKEQLRLKQLGKKDFIQYFTKLTRKRSGSNHGNWTASLHYLIAFTGGDLKIHDLNQLFCDEFKEYLLTTNSIRSPKSKLSQNSSSSYFNKFKAALKQSYRDGILQEDLNEKVKSIKPSETLREHLTIEELNTLVGTICANTLLKRAALFSALTGLRFSDIQKLLQSEIEYIEGQGHFIKFRQQKTKGMEMLPISEQAVSLMDLTQKESGKVFDGLKYSAYQNKHLVDWIKAAEIKKKITFHCFRHTYAVLQLSGGTDIYTVSKMLGHRELKTTQVYAKIVDQAKRDATDRIILNL